MKSIAAISISNTNLPFLKDDEILDRHVISYKNNDIIYSVYVNYNQQDVIIEITENGKRKSLSNIGKNELKSLLNYIEKIINKEYNINNDRNLYDVIKELPSSSDEYSFGYDLYYDDGILNIAKYDYMPRSKKVVIDSIPIYNEKILIFLSSNVLKTLMMF